MSTRLGGRCHFFQEDIPPTNRQRVDSDSDPDPDSDSEKNEIRENLRGFLAEAAIGASNPFYHAWGNIGPFMFPHIVMSTVSPAQARTDSHLMICFRNSTLLGYRLSLEYLDVETHSLPISPKCSCACQLIRDS